MSRWSFIAQRAVTGEFLDWDIPLHLGSLEWELSGPGSLKATLNPDVGGLRASDGSPLFEEWGTLLYAESGGEIRWGGIVVHCSFEGEQWNLEAAGFSTYPHARTYRGEYSRVQVDPAEVIKHIWTHLQSYPDADLGVQVVGDKTPVRLGQLAYAEDENGVRLDFAIPHKQWEDLFKLGWVGGPVHRIHVAAELWDWLLTHGFYQVADDAIGAVAVPPSTWAEEFPWWESELLNLGWVGGPVRSVDVRPELFTYLKEHGWTGRGWDREEQVYPPTLELDEEFPDEVWAALYQRQYAGGQVRRQDVEQWIWESLIKYGFTLNPSNSNLLDRPSVFSTSTGLKSWEVELLNLGWVGGPVRREHVSDTLWNTLLEGHWRGRPGDGAEQVYPPVPASVVLDEDDTVHEAEPYELMWFEAPNCGEEIADLVKTAPMDYAERHRWGADGSTVLHEIELGYPRLGRRRDDLVFVQGDNVTDVVTVESNGEEFANSVIGLGAGEGRRILYRAASTRDGRLARDTVYSDKAVNSVDRMDALISEELNARKAALRVTSLTVQDHPNAPLGSWQLGDDVLVRADLPWLGEVEVWVRITGWSLTSESTATLTVQRSDLFRYGG